jgi:GT2 family glycosyltransferase
VTAAALLVRKDIYCEVGGFEEALTVAFNDVDFCLKVREAGYRNVWTPFAQLIHHESVSRGYEDTPEKQQRFAQEISYMKEKWQGALSNDPFYSPNLTNKHEDFSLRVNKS